MLNAMLTTATACPLHLLYIQILYIGFGNVVLGSLLRGVFAVVVVVVILDCAFVEIECVVS